MSKRRTSKHSLRIAMLGLCAVIVPPIPASAAAGTRHVQFSIIERWKLPGSGSWDLLTFDAPRQRLFIARSDRVEVVDANTGTVLGRIADTAGVHGIALAPALNRGYTSNGRSNSVTEFDYDTLKALREVPVPGLNPDVILYEAHGGHLVTVNGHSKNVTIYDARTLTVLATIPLPDAPEFAVDGENGRLYVNIESDQGQLAEIDTMTFRVVATWPLPGCESPSGLAFDAARERLFSVCANRTMVITDARTGRQVARLPIGEHPDGAGYDARRGLAFSSNGVGTLTVVQADGPDRYAVATTLVTQPGARTMTLDPASGRIYLVSADFGVPPPATTEHPHPRAPPLPDTFTILVAAPHSVTCECQKKATGVRPGH
jgi:DNA-binding beta-propeller fold protein YncE